MDVVETLKQLVAIPSVNPMGRDVSGPEYFEYRVTDYLEQLFRNWGLTYERQFVAEKRENILVRLEGSTPPASGGQLILFEVHQDTVPVTGMTIEPWTPTVRDGRIYGRGSCDIKGGMAAMLVAIERLHRERPAGMPTIVLACTVNEEHGYTGATALTKLFSPGARSKILERAPDAAVVAEPTLLQVVVAHKGVVRWRLHTVGRAAHSSQPQLGENAIFKMAKVLAVLERYQRDVAPNLGQHPLCGRPTLSVGTIIGGLSVNTVADRATIEIDRRVLPGETTMDAYRHVIEFVARETKLADIVHDEPFLIGLGLAERHNQAVADSVAAAAREVTGECEKIGVPYGTDAAAIAAAGVPSIVFGPGSIDQAHTADEWLAIDQLEKASEVYYRFGRSGIRD